MRGRSICCSRLAREQKVDLGKISILALADQYLAFIARQRSLSLEIAADYLVMAAWLAYLKSRLLLPQPPQDDEPSGAELAAELEHRLRLLEAMQTAGGRLMARPRTGQDVFLRGVPEGLAVIPVPVYELALYELLRAYGEGRRRTEAAVLTIEPADVPFDGRGVEAGWRAFSAACRIGASWRASCRGAARRGVPALGARRDLRRHRSSWRAAAASSCARTGPSARSICAASPAAAAIESEAAAVSERAQQLRLVEALLFAVAEPIGEEALARHLDEAADVAGLLRELAESYAGRGVNLVRLAGGWTFRTAPDLAPNLRIERPVARKLSRAAVETLAVIAYHQPVTRAEIEQIRGVALGKGTIDTLMEAGWVRPKGRRAGPGRPLLWVTTPGFLVHFGLDSLNELPGLDELRAAGLLDLAPIASCRNARSDTKLGAGGARWSLTGRGWRAGRGCPYKPHLTSSRACACCDHRTRIL